MLRTHLTDSKQQAAVIDATSASGRTSTASWWRARAGSTRSSSSSAAAAVASCEEALAEFESEALSAELTNACPTPTPDCTRSKGATTDGPLLRSRPRDPRARTRNSRLGFVYLRTEWLFVWNPGGWLRRMVLSGEWVADG
jgi:hypothetical protein